MKKTQFLRSKLRALGVFALSLAGCRLTQQTQPDHPRLAPGVTMQDVSFFSAALKRNMPYRVFLPAKLVPGQKLPVVYLFHGGSRGFHEWSNYSDVARYAAPDLSGGLIFVMPEPA
ncbi:MAG TPA: alpha/beta hydrolase-fold protein [Terracidiphilus sp.]|jgi:poly(3-hydroxybutyrate) depolymerase